MVTGRCSTIASQASPTSTRAGIKTLFFFSIASIVMEKRESGKKNGIKKGLASGLIPVFKAKDLSLPVFYRGWRGLLLCRVAESDRGHCDFQSHALPTELTRPPALFLNAA